ncbi:sucrose-6-phosphate hydrolase [Verticillium alfalfae VaMs.102]|uniref:Sucrose-6-phosphate hydrolase n=1 Tax=Verticillium alfalfae (strain VaMs.102 / ATCC MYA-4576 / FGSC 10136) TaxID=526221 RepID=C9SSV7_VERA1|nr:sucrose-6-phosphate hydrolase [Verticillium alfalfae VaMs.102]EEY21872.1 sucrose-6-phosphate hydrolase [Verticillium alfalfae VaMs.102]
MSWGHATSQDGLRWTHASSGEPALKPSEPYDKEGIFTGCFWPTGPHGEKDQLTVVYSSIAALPIHWTLKHIRNSEGVSLATSTDAGKTWQKSELNPILVGEPEGVEVTGFRDPFLAEWPALDRIRGEKSLYGFLSGGVVDKGPTVFLYAIQPDNLTEWKYLGPLVDLAPGFRAPGSWTSDFGVNWECVNFISLKDGAHEQDFLLMGTEGGVKPRYKEGDEEPLGQWSSWFSGSVEQTAAGPRLRHEFDGVLDHGSLYAPNSYVHPETQKRITIGWVREDGLPMSRCKARGWTGFLSLPRELFLSTTHNVTRGPEITNRGHSFFQDYGERLGWKDCANAGNQAHGRPPNTAPLPSGRVSTQAEARRFHIWQSPDGVQRTTVYFIPQAEQIVVDKSLSNTEADVDKSLLDAPFTLLYSLENETEKLEKLRLRIFRDGDVLEVFANDRFALTTTVYCDDSCAGISWFLDDEGSHSVFDSVQLWEDMAGTQGQVLDIGQPHL